MKRMRKKKGLSILMAMMLVMTTIWSNGLVAHAMETVIVAPENLLNVQVVDEEGNEINDYFSLLMVNENDIEVAKWRANNVFYGHSGKVDLNDSGITVGDYFFESWSTFEPYVAPGKLFSISHYFFGPGGSYQPFYDGVPFNSPSKELDLTLGYFPVRETALTVPADTLVINTDEKWASGYADLKITYGETDYIVKDMAGAMKSISMPANSEIKLIAKKGGYTITNTREVVLGEESEYVKVRMKVSDVDYRFNDDGTLNDDDDGPLHIASGTRTPGEVYLIIISGGVINYPVPDADGYVEFYVEKESGKYFYTYSKVGDCGYGGGSSGTEYAIEEVTINFRAIDFPETGTTLHNVPAGTYKISLTSVPDGYEDPGEIEVVVEESQEIQELKIVLKEEHEHSFATEYKKDATNHWKECACGEKSGEEAHNPGPAATEDSAQTCTVCGYEIAPKLDHDFGTEYKKDATNHWKECACGEKSGVEAHNPGPAATEESAQTCTVCGYEIAPKLDHDFGTEYKKDATNHWKECACGEKSGVEAHNPGPAATEDSAQTCTVCGYEIAPKLDHDFGTEYKKDATNHWKECACGEKSGVEAHNPGPAATEESAQTCTVCGYEIAPKLDHDFGTEYKKDATNHWKECACGEKSGVEAHNPGPAATEESAQTCTVCGYEIAPKLDHDFGTEYKKDATNHWKECACGEKSGVEAHNPGPAATEESAQTCTVCGYEIAPKLGHDFGTEYKKDATNHWKECACGEKSGVEAHNPGPAATEESAQTCTVCGYEIAPKLGHDFGTEYKKDATNHWKECACGEKTGVEAHVPGPEATEQSAQTCTVCGYEIAPKLDHDFGTEYKKDATNHWKECACGEKSGVEAHNPGPAATEESAQTCTVCGYEIAPKLGHDFGTEYKKDATNHWKECACGEKSGVEAHVPGPEATEQCAQTCTVCGYEIAPKLDHNFGTEYKKDATNHWKECACGEKSGVEVHNPGPAATEDSAQTCTVCGYEIAPKLDHDFGTEYKKDATNHWKECACGEKSGVEAHNPGPAATEESAQTCTVCGYEIAPKLDHDFGTEYKKDATNHWKECACGEKSGVEAHNPGPAATEESAQTCTVCGYEIAPVLTPEEEHIHSFNGYKYNDSEHWGECSCGVRSQMLPHEFEWIVDKNATQQESGSKHEECAYCHYGRPAVEIAKLGITSPKTGDNTYQWIFLLAGISGMLGMGTLAYRKKEK